MKLKGKWYLWMMFLYNIWIRWYMKACWWKYEGMFHAWKEVKSGGIRGVETGTRGYPHPISRVSATRFGQNGCPDTHPALESGMTRYPSRVSRTRRCVYPTRVCPNFFKIYLWLWLYILKCMCTVLYICMGVCLCYTYIYYICVCGSSICG